MNKSKTFPITDAPIIGTLNEGSLHASLKQFVAQPGDGFEVPIDGFVIDIVREEKHKTTLVEIQTTSFASMRKKLSRLLPHYPIRIIYPVAVETFLVKPDKKPRKSPKKGTVFSIFEELVSIPGFILDPNLSFEVLCVSVRKVQEYDPSLRRRRGGYRTVNTELSEILSIQKFEGVEDFLDLLPKGLPKVFTTSDIASLGKISRQNAQQIAYCFRKAGVFLELSHTKEGKHYEIR